MRCVLMTTLGVPVEPEVKRYLACVSGVIAAWACITAGVSTALASCAKGRAPGCCSLPRLNTCAAFSETSRNAGA